MTASERIQAIRKKMVEDPPEFFAVEFELEPRSTALLIIDMQKFGCCPDVGWGPLSLKEAPQTSKYWYSRIHDLVVPNIQELLAFFRGNRLRVIHVCIGPLLPDASDMHSRERIRVQRRARASGFGHYFYPGTLEHEIIDELKPQEGEMVINKNSFGAFNSTNIDQILRNMGIDGLVITGVATNSCVETTARDAGDRGYNCILVDDACAAKSQEMHDMALVNCTRMFGKVMTTQEVMGYLELRLKRDKGQLTTS